MPDAPGQYETAACTLPTNNQAHLWEDQGSEHARIDGSMPAERKVQCHSYLGHIDGAHSDPLGGVHPKGHRQRLQAHLPAGQIDQNCHCASMGISGRQYFKKVDLSSLSGSRTILHQPNVICLAVSTSVATCRDCSHISLQDGAVRQRQHSNMLGITGRWGPS